MAKAGHRFDLDTRTMSDKDDKSTHDLLERLRATKDQPFWRRFLHGLALPLRAGRLLAEQRSLWVFVIAPALINLLLFGGTLYLFLSNVGTIAEWIWVMPEIGHWQDWLLRAIWYVLVTLVAILSIGAAYIFVLLIGGIVASPFNDKLSEHVEAVLLPSGEPAEREESVVWAGVRALGSSIFILGSYVIIMAPILLLNLVPLAGPVAATALGTVVSALFLAMEYTDAPVDRRGNDLKTKFELIEAHRALALGFGLGASLLFWIPFINFLTIPLSVTGGTALGIVLAEWEI